MKRILLVFALVMSLGAMMPLAVRADEPGQEAEITDLNQFMVASEKLEAKELPDHTSDTVITYKSGDIVFVVGETADGWYKVSYQGKEGYVLKSLLTMQEFDVEGLDKEFQESEPEGKLVIEEVERYRAEAKRSKIWGIVIVLLIAGIFATGIISTLRRGKGKSDHDGPDANEKDDVVKMQDMEEQREGIIDLDQEE